jgi:uncharacterized protein YijF (DUF1287 family)
MHNYLRRHCVTLLLLLLLLACCTGVLWRSQLQGKSSRPNASSFGDRLAYAAEDIVDPDVVYDPAYVRIPYPGGDVPAKRGVCADVVIRAYRHLGIDLQVLVH